MKNVINKTHKMTMTQIKLIQVSKLIIFKKIINLNQSNGYNLKMVNFIKFENQNLSWKIIMKNKIFRILTFKMNLHL